jgi:hypothetical protein
MNLVVHQEAEFTSFAIAGDRGAAPLAAPAVRLEGAHWSEFDRGEATNLVGGQPGKAVQTPILAKVAPIACHMRQPKLACSLHIDAYWLMA